MRAIALALLISGCSSLPPVPTEVRIPIATPCLDTLPETPDFLPDSDLATLEDYAFVIALRIEQLKAREAYDELRALATACVKSVARCSACSWPREQSFATRR